jgi:glycosyltransferase involved in cell wall biosynthesis
VGGGFGGGAWDIHCLGVHDRGDPHSLPCSIWACRDENEAVLRVVDAARGCDPDAILLFSDIAVCGQWAMSLARAAGGKIPCPVLVYAPVDGGGMVPELVEWLGRDWYGAGVGLATYTEWGRREMAAALAGARVDMEPSIVSHAAEWDVFQPMDRDEARRRLGVAEHVGDGFVLLNANTNTARKRIDLTIAAFARFLGIEGGAFSSSGFPARLWLHMDARGAWDVRALMRRECMSVGVTDWERHLMLTTDDHKELYGVSDEAMNLIYNAADAGISTSGGEGWGLTCWEHAACARPQIVVDYAAYSEIFPEGSAYKVPPTVLLTVPTHLQVHGIPHPDEVAEVISRVYRDCRTENRAVAEAGRAVATVRTWDQIADQMDELLFQLMTKSGAALEVKQALPGVAA